MNKLEQLAKNYAGKIFEAIDERLMWQYRKEPWIEKLNDQIYQLCATLKDNLNAQVYKDAIFDAEQKFAGYYSPEEFKQKTEGLIKKPSTGLGARLKFLFTGKL